jgi:hypothetical protein
MPEMPDDELRNAVHAIVSRLQSDVETQLSELGRRHQSECERIRREVESRTAEVLSQEWSAKLEQARVELDRVRTDSEARLRAELAEAAAASDARVAAETARLLAEAEQAASEATNLQQQQREQAVLDASARVRDEVRQEMEQRAAEAAKRAREAIEQSSAETMARTEQEYAVERARLAAELDAERQRVQALASSLDQAQATLAEERNAREAAQAQLAAAESREQMRLEESTTVILAEERQAKVAMVEQLLSAVGMVSEARSLSDTLNALAGAAASLAPRVALFIFNERSGSRELQGWRASGFSEPSPAMMRLPADDSGLLATAASTRTTISTSRVSAPEFAALASDRAALAVPLTVGGKTVAVLYADDGAGGEAEAPASWPEAIQILGDHASVCLSHITAVRTTQAMRASIKGDVRSEAGSDEHHSARRYARLLVSEIKLYNEAAVRAGREKRDLLTRLRPEIERARRLYEERIPASIGARGKYFQEELVHTLADGDAGLLGSA